LNPYGPTYYSSHSTLSTINTSLDKLLNL